MTQSSDFSSLKLGKLAAVRPDMDDLDLYAEAPLPAPPVAAHNGGPITNLLNIDGNQTYGDCVIAGLSNSVAVWNHIVSGDGTKPIPVPTADQAVTQYFELEGAPNGAPDPSLDNGLSESATLATARKLGLFGNALKIPYYAPITPSRIMAVKQAVAFYGLCYAGFQLPESAQQQFGANQPFTVTSDTSIAGGHCMVAFGYDAEWVYLYTWQRIVPASWAFWHQYADEAYGLIPQSYITAGRGPLTAPALARLEADLSSL